MILPGVSYVQAYAVVPSQVVYPVLVPVGYQQYQQSLPQATISIVQGETLEWTDVENPLLNKEYRFFITPQVDVDLAIMTDGGQE